MVGLLCGVYLLFGMISFFISSEQKKVHQNDLFGSDRPCWYPHVSETEDQIENLKSLNIGAFT